MKIDLDQLQDQTEKLLYLLQDREPGLIEWHIMLTERLKGLHDIIDPLFKEAK